MSRPVSQPDAAPLPPRYRLIERLSSGRTGEVFLCAGSTSADLPQLSVVKALYHHLTASRAIADRLYRDLELLGRISHPNILQVREVGESHERIFVATPYIEGGSLAEIAKFHAEKRREPLPTWIIFKVLTDALNALQTAHQAVDEAGNPMPIVHGALSPGNILIDTYGNARLTCFGLAKAAAKIASDIPDAPKRGVFLAPELLLGGPVDHRADIFSAGAILTSALLGRPLFIHTNQLIDPRIPPPSQSRGDLSRWLDSICVKALRPDPADRYQSAAEMSQALNHAMVISGPAGPAQNLGSLIADIFDDRIATRRELVRLTTARRSGARTAQIGAPEPARSPSMGTPEAAMGRAESSGGAPMGAPELTQSAPGTPIQVSSLLGSADSESTRERTARPTGVFFQDDLMLVEEPPSWPFLQSPQSNAPSKLTMLQPGDKSRQRQYRAIGIAVLLIVACVIAAVGITQLLIWLR